MTAPQTFTFAVYPADLGDTFEAFLMDVPTLNGEDAAARRAWWTAFHWCGSRGIEPEDFTVSGWDTTLNAPGRLVTAGGYADAVAV